jgi:nucleoside-triphosphatase THEP1
MTKRWALIVGDKGAGKSTTATRVVNMLAARGIAVGGVIQEAVHEDGERVAYRACHVGHENHGVIVAHRGAPPKGLNAEAMHEFCSFVFDDDAFATAGSWVRQAVSACDVVIVDEVSKLEVSGGGHHNAIRDALTGRALVILVVRSHQLFAVVDKFGLDDAVADLEVGDDGALETFVGAIVRAVRTTESSS